MKKIDTGRASASENREHRSRTGGSGVAVLLLALLLLPLHGCSSLGTTERGAIIGAASGAAVGGAIGKAAGSTARGAIIGAAVGGAAGAYIGNRMEDKARVLRERLPEAEVERVGEGILVTFPGGLLFDFDSSALRSEARRDLTRLADGVGDMEVEVLVAGHTDSTGSEDYNYDLSLRRARSATDHLIEQGLPAERVKLTGLGESEPVATNETDAGRQRNRRVEVAIYASEEMKREAQEQVGN